MMTVQTYICDVDKHKYLCIYEYLEERGKAINSLVSIKNQIFNITIIAIT